MGHRINERNVGSWSLDSEPKNRKTKTKKTSRSFTNEEIELFNYIITTINDNLVLNNTDLDNQYFQDNGKITIKISRDNIEDIHTLKNKFK